MTDPFNNSIENMQYSKDYSYLLNFWHTTKLNKEFEFIKRNGIHPSVVTVTKNGANEVTVKDGNTIQTNFYTVFRIFMERIFKDIKTSKERSAEEWIVTFKPDISGLDTYSYLIMGYARSQNIASSIITYPTSYRHMGTGNFKVKLTQKDQLHSKVLLQSLEDFDMYAKANIDQNITFELNALLQKLATHMDFSESTKVKKSLKKTVEVEEVRPIPMPNRILNGLEELIPVFRNLNQSVQSFPHRTRFSYILSFAKQSGTNQLINLVEDTDGNYRAFMTLTNNMAA